MKTTEKLSALVAILRGKPDLAKQILDDAENVQKAAEAAGLEFKDVEEMISTDEPILEVETPAPVDAEVEKKPDEAPEVEVIQTEAKAAPTPPPAEPEPDEIGDMTRQELADFCAGIVKQMMGKKDAEAELKQAGRDQILTDAIASLKALGERSAAVEKALEETKQALQELTDARPVGLKRLQESRPTERMDNIVQSAPTGPQMDPDFVKFALGGK